MVTRYRGKLYWFWGDSNKVSYPLGHFATAGATSELPGNGGLDPSVGVDLTYFVDESGFSKPMCDIIGPGLKWMFWVTTVRDQDGRERLIGRYRSMKRLGEPLEGGLVIFNDKTEAFERLVRFTTEVDPQISIHPFRAVVDGEEYLYLHSPYPDLRVKANLQRITDPRAYEAFTCLVAGSHYDKAAPRLDRRPNGRLAYAWKAYSQPIDFDRQQELIAAGKMRPDEVLVQLRDIETDASIKPHASTVFWNDFRRRWVMIVQEDRGLADNGEIWFVEADTPVGPWVYAKKVVTHNKYTFYNPAHHPFFDQDGGRLIYFEATYSDFFSGSPEKTPRYDYNQIMYRLDLNDPRLNLPVPVYRVKGADGSAEYLMREDVDSADAWDRIEEAPFFALPPDRRREGLIPIFSRKDKEGVVLERGPSGGKTNHGKPMFYALPLELRTSEEKLPGTWRCKAKASDGSEYLFTLDLQLQGEEVKARSDREGLTFMKGEFREGRLKLNARLDEDSYLLTGSLEQGKLAGEWKQVNAAQGGMWEGERADTDFLSQQISSPATAPLYEHRRGEPGPRFYSTNPELQLPALQRSAEALCRVWRNPNSLLILDRKAKSDPITGP